MVGSNIPVVSIRRRTPFQRDYPCSLQRSIVQGPKPSRHFSVLQLTFLRRFIFSEEYLQSVGPDLALNILCAVANPLSTEGMRRIVKGALASVDLRPSLLNMTLPLILVQVRNSKAGVEMGAFVFPALGNDNMSGTSTVYAAGVNAIERACISGSCARCSCCVKREGCHLNAGNQTTYDAQISAATIHVATASSCYE